MKVAVYTIALNEEQFVEPWYESAKDADYLLIADTGSTDNTVKWAQERGINVVTVLIKPWRFDMARNASLAALPADIDYCIALDMDEVLLPGWRKELEKAHKKGATRPRYQYTWNWKADGTPGLQYGGDKIHTRFGYRWKHPVHEVLTTYGDKVEIQDWVGLEIHHHADNTKARSQYLPLLKQAVDEDPYDDRNAFYYARELYFYHRWDEAANEFKRHLGLPRAVWPPERAASMRYLAKIETDKTEYWSNRAVEEAPGRREPLVDLAKYYYGIGNWVKCYEAASAALAIQEKPLEYLCEDEAWGYAPHDYKAIAAYHMQKYHDAVEHGATAVQMVSEEIFPDEKKRLSSNLSFYVSALREVSSEPAL
jgi:glycosyltransferase involved in cell wall biosynthesis